MAATLLAGTTSPSCCDHEQTITCAASSQRKESDELATLTTIYTLVGWMYFNDPEEELRQEEEESELTWQKMRVSMFEFLSVLKRNE